MAEKEPEDQVSDSGFLDFITNESRPEVILQRLRQGSQITEGEALILAQAVNTGQVTITPEEAEQLSQVPDIELGPEAERAAQAEAGKSGIGDWLTAEPNTEAILAKLKRGQDVSDPEVRNLAHAIATGKMDVDESTFAGLDDRLAQYVREDLENAETQKALGESPLYGILANLGAGVVNLGPLPRFLATKLGGEEGMAASMKALLKKGRIPKTKAVAKWTTAVGGGGLLLANVMNMGTQAREAGAAPTGTTGQPGTTGTTQPGTVPPGAVAGGVIAGGVAGATGTVSAATGSAVGQPGGPVGYVRGPNGQLVPVQQSDVDPHDILYGGQTGMGATGNYSPLLMALAQEAGIDTSGLGGSIEQDDAFNPNMLGTVTLDQTVTLPGGPVPYKSVQPRAETEVTYDQRIGYGGVSQSYTSVPDLTILPGAEINPKLLTEFNGKSLLEWAADAAAKYDVPLNILYGLIEMESNWDVNAVGDNGTSFGLAQIHTPAFPDVDQATALNPAYALHFAARNLHERFELYGRWDAAVASHNSPVAGEYLASTGEFQTAKSQDYVTNIFNYANKSGLDSYKADAAGIEVSPEAQSINVTPFAAPDPAAIRNYIREQSQTLLGRDPSQEELNAGVRQLTDLYRAGYAINTRNALRAQGLSEDVVQSVNLSGSTATDTSGGLSYGFLEDVQDPGNEAARNNKAHYEEAQAGTGIWGARAKFAAYAAPQILQMFPGTSNWGQFRDPSVSATGAMSPTSDHYSGGALDIHGTPEQMEGLAQWAKSQPWAANVIYGVAGHTDHVHISFKLGYTVPDGQAVAYNQGELGSQTTGGGIYVGPDEMFPDPEAQYEEGLRTSGEFEFQSQQTKLRSMTDFAAEIARMLQTGSI